MDGGRKRPTQTFNQSSGFIQPQATNGFQYLLDHVIPKRDVIIFSDNHNTSQTRYADFLNSETVAKLSRAGITDIHLEMNSSLNPLREKLLRGEITAGQFADQSSQAAISLTGLTPDQHRTLFQRLGQDVLSAQRLGVEVHFSQVDLTPEQETALAGREQDVRNRAAPVMGEFNKKAMDIDSFLKQAGMADNQRFNFMADMGITQGIRNAMTHEKMDKVFGETLTPSQKEILRADLQTLSQYGEQIDSLQQPLLEMLKEFRMSSDAALAGTIHDSIRDGGKAVVIHGALHGASGKNDLDDHLAHAGLSVMRINLEYGEQDKASMQQAFDQGQRPDASDVLFNPRTDTISIIDFNGDGVVNGDHPPSLPPPAIPGQRPRRPGR